MGHRAGASGELVDHGSCSYEHVPSGELTSSRQATRGCWAWACGSVGERVMDGQLRGTIWQGWLGARMYAVSRATMTVR